MIPGSGYYDAEAPAYDETRGGTARAASATTAIGRLVTGPPGTALDVAGGTGIVSAALAGRGWSVLVTDASMGMLRIARERLPRRVVAADATRLPVRDDCVDLVTAVWLLHLLAIPGADAVVAEARRVLRPGGWFVTTVDKDLAQGRVRRTNGDHRDRLEQVARRLGLTPAGSTYFAAETKGGAGIARFPVAAFRKPQGEVAMSGGTSSSRSTRCTTRSMARPAASDSSSGQAG